MQMVWYKKTEEDWDNFNSSVLVKLTKEWDFDDPIGMIKDVYNYRCSHNWDCCGCLMSRVQDIMSCGGKYYLVKIGNYRNV